MSVRKSLPVQKNVHGVIIKKLPIGAYLSALESVRELPVNLIERLFPNISCDDALIKMKSLDSRGILLLLSKAISVLPEEIFSFLSIILDISVDKIRDELTPSQLADILEAFWKVNELENFIRIVRGALAALR